MGRLPRHAFVPENMQEQAYDDRPLPIGYSQTISQPFIVALMTDLLALEPDDVVLEVGTGSGYQAAVLAELVEEVHSIEIVPGLAESAAERLDGLGFDNVETHQGDGYYGIAAAAPFDAIVVTAAANSVPPPLIAQLKPGGRMVIPVGSSFAVQHLMIVEKDEAGQVRTRQTLPVRFVPLTRGCLSLMQLAAIALISAAILAYEVLLARLFSIIQWYHFAYMVISIALLGLRRQRHLHRPRPRSPDAPRAARVRRARSAVRRERDRLLRARPAAAVQPARDRLGPEPAGPAAGALRLLDRALLLRRRLHRLGARLFRRAGRPDLSRRSAWAPGPARSAIIAVLFAIMPDTALKAIGALALAAAALASLPTAGRGASRALAFAIAALASAGLAGGLDRAAALALQGPAPGAPGAGRCDRDRALEPARPA